MKIFDTHVHLNEEPLLSQFDTLIKKYESMDLFANIIGTDLKNSQVAIELANKSKNTYCSIAMHPTECYESDVNETIDALRKMYLTKPNKIIAIGECGLDYHYPETNKSKQLAMFTAQILLAIELKLPIILHIRDAHDDAIAILKKYPELKNVIIHCYSDNLEYANQYLALGCYISFSGIITFKKATWLQEIAHKIDINHILTETDAPWLSPEPNRGQVNESSNMVHINACLAKIKGLKIEEMDKILLSNAHNVLKL